MVPSLTAAHVRKKERKKKKSNPGGLFVVFNALKMFAGRNIDVAMMCAHDLYEVIAIKLKLHCEGS